MLRITHLRFKNFLSVGNKFIEYDFEEDNIYLIKGTNGAGKSVIIDALTFGLYGRAHRKINLGEIVNKINGRELVVEVEFQHGKNKYKVVRGLDPGIFKIYINGKLQKSDADRRHQQKTFEQSILKMDLKTFRQLIVLGSKSYTPFMTMGRADRVLIVEDLLNIGIYGTMYQILKGKISEIESRRIILAERLTALENSIETNKEYLDRVKNKDENKINQELNSRLNLLIKKKQEADDSMGDLYESLHELQKEFDTKFDEHVKKEYERLQRAQNKIEFKKQSLIDELRFFNNNDNCPTCHRDIEDEFKNTMISKTKEQIDQHEKDLFKCNGLIDIRKTKLDRMTSLQKNIDEKQVDLKMFKLEIENIDRRIKETQRAINKEEKQTAEDVGFIHGKIEALENQRQDVEDEIEDINDRYRIYDRISELLKSGGIKKKIIKAYVPLINKLIRKYLDVMEFNVDFRFDEDFNETIKVRGREEFSYGNFSDGEKLRIDLCLLFTWREISRMKNNAAANLIIFDEIGDSSLDDEGFDCFMRILRSDQNKQCAIIITHKTDVLENKTDRVYEYVKVGNFTELAKKNVQEIEKSVI